MRFDRPWLSAVGLRPSLPALRERRHDVRELLEIDGLDEVCVEAGIPRRQAIARLPVAGHRDQGDLSARDAGHVEEVADEADEVAEPLEP